MREKDRSYFLFRLPTPRSFSTHISTESTTVPPDPDIRRPSPAADGTQQQQSFKQSSSGLTSESHSITTLRGSTHFTLRYCLPSVTPAHSCSTPAASSSPVASSSFLQLPALSCSIQHSCTFQNSCSFQLTPAAFSSLLQLPALLPLPDHSCSLQLTPAALYRRPATYSSTR
ncbi:unnamed protein product [Acanthosepion pharaonis]|uniref:Uncharacterized protein n=1 Tax=Acanthosepion pharaonis TaxID=158019 RepID=A0A812DSF8_ACAPH|nr:unnamed protein product [Sepia pharaonis]